ncbi:MAG TPA: hypothetical protein VK524_31585 [Polyangiaceae bacterium]|nr:hypothetical protein [Polyangiaceae bacterium]
MAYALGLVHNVFIVRWIQPAAGDAKKILKALRAARDSCSGPIVYLAVLPEDCTAPEESTRKEISDGIPVVLEYCSSIHMVLEGSSMKRATMRAIAAGMFLLTGKRGRVMTHETVLEALRRAEKLRVSPELIIAAAKAQKLLT